MNLFNSILPHLGSATTPAKQTNGESQPEFTLRPVHQIDETPEAWTLVAHLPGVNREGLEITAEEGSVTIRGRRQWQQPAGWTSLYRESYESAYALTLEHDHSVDASRIQAELKDGVLRVSLPKAEAVKPRKIAVN
jgi:HSP20 family protein